MATLIEGGSPSLPDPPTLCPSLSPGLAYFNVLGSIRSARIWSSPNNTGGILVIYWHDGGSTPQEAIQVVGSSVINDIVKNGGIVAAPFSDLDPNAPWYPYQGSPDAILADQIASCAVLRKNISASKIYTIGFGQGGLMAGKLSIERSNYIASVVLYSGGIFPFNSYTFRNPGSQLSALIFQGGPQDSAFSTNFYWTSWNYIQTLRDHWPLHYIRNCQHSLLHAVPNDALAAAYVFIQSTAFSQSPTYGNNIPANFPEYCQTSPQNFPFAPSASTPQDCPVGTYFNNSICNFCPAGSSSSPGSSSISDCFCLPGYTQINGICTACPTNHYKSSIGNGSCSSCQIYSVSYSGSSSQQSCFCVSGHYGLDGTLCQPCPPGTYKNTSGSNNCISCPPHSSSQEGAVGTWQCYCNLGYFGDPDTGCYGVQYVIIGVFVTVILLIILGVSAYFVLKKKEKKAQRMRTQQTFGGVFNDNPPSDPENEEEQPPPPQPEAK